MHREMQNKIKQLEERLKAAETEAGKVKDLEARLERAEKEKGSSTEVAKTGEADGPAGPLVSRTEGRNWKGGVAFQGGPQHYAMASDAFKMAIDLKDRGDDRSFSMIFDQLFMEQRRTVGVKSKTNPDGGYNSSKLMQDVFEKAKELKDKGDDRPFGLIFAGLSMQYRRGHVKW